MKKVTVLGSSGSIGLQTLDVIRAHSDRFKVVGLSVRSDIETLVQHVKEFRPAVVAVADADAAAFLEQIECEILVGDEGVATLAAWDGADTVVNALVGSAGLRSTLSAISAGRELALANKESMVAGGDLVKEALRKSGSSIIPVDSEHSAIFACLVGESRVGVSKILLTGSGGPFRGKTIADLMDVTVEEALAHPRWRMGPKISVDSATMMNKGLEVIEAHYLFDVAYGSIEVIVHLESTIHSMVEFADGSIKAQLAPTDMRIPIQYALSYPEHLSSPVQPLDLIELGKLTFEAPDLVNFPALRLAIEAGRLGGAYPAVMNAANEEAVAAFLAGSIRFVDIAPVVEAVLDSFGGERAETFDILMKIEAGARQTARVEIDKRQR
ncbi:MAG: 1-deoxy-D-xylulose-5-phosphate reductoisomerase [Actinobacteria bacterium]|nr:1-deoxy-D-xylulose-5-phosphate reductoisomerase [Actinomycetota bacterium]